MDANVAYPTDSGPIAKGVVKLVATVAKLKAMGLAQRTKPRDRARSVPRRAHAMDLAAAAIGSSQRR